jgi:1-deoxy-D-xylulose-5-phosphate reductoisomerase
LTFEQPDTETFRNLQLAFNAMAKGGNLACIMNAANEIAVDAFLQDKIGFLQMSDLIETCMQKVAFIESPSIDDYIQTDEATRRLATTLI